MLSLEKEGKGYLDRRNCMYKGKEVGELKISSYNGGLEEKWVRDEVGNVGKV